jgi:hypothetical protein
MVSSASPCGHRQRDPPSACLCNESTRHMEQFDVDEMWSMQIAVSAKAFQQVLVERPAR